MPKLSVTAKDFVQGEIPLPLSEVEPDLERQATAWAGGDKSGNTAQKTASDPQRFYTGYRVADAGGGNASISATDYLQLKGKWEGKGLVKSFSSLTFRVAWSGSDKRTTGPAKRADFILQDQLMRPAHIFVFHIDVLGGAGLP